MQSVPIKSSQFKPLKDNILVKPITMDTEKTTDTGICLEINKTSSITDRPTMGEVIATGSGVTDIVVGDNLFWPLTDGIDFEFTDGEFMLLRYDSIIGIS